MSKLALALFKSEVRIVGLPKPDGCTRFYLQVGDSDTQPIFDLLKLAGQQPRVTRNAALTGILVLDLVRANAPAARQFVIWLRKLPGMQAVLLDA